MENAESMWTKFVLVDNDSNRNIGRDKIGQDSGDESDSDGSLATHDSMPALRSASESDVDDDESDSDASLATHDSMPALRSASESDVDDDLFEKSCLDSDVGDGLFQKAGEDVQTQRAGLLHFHWQILVARRQILAARRTYVPEDASIVAPEASQSDVDSEECESDVDDLLQKGCLEDPEESGGGAAALVVSMREFIDNVEKQLDHTGKVLQDTAPN